MALFLQKVYLKFQLKSLMWNFSASSHGKGAVDGIGGCLKRLVWRRVKARQCDVTCATEFVSACKDANIDTVLFSPEEIDTTFHELDQEFGILTAPKVANIQRSHQWIAKDSDQVVTTNKLTTLGAEGLGGLGGILPQFHQIDKLLLSFPRMTLIPMKIVLM